MRLESIAAPLTPANAAGPLGACPHCGAPLVRVVTSIKYLRVGDVCSAGWNAPYSPTALPCGALALAPTRVVA